MCKIVSLNRKHPTTSTTEKNKSTKISGLVTWTDLIDFIRNSRSVGERLHETSWVSHASSVVETSKNPSFRTDNAPLSFYAVNFSQVCRLNLNFKWKEAKKRPCGRKVGHMQMRESSVGQSFISEVGYPNHVWRSSLSIFFNLRWVPHLENNKQ